MNAFKHAPAMMVAIASLAAAYPASAAVDQGSTFRAPTEQGYHHGRERYSREDWRRGYGSSNRYYDEPVYRDTRVWRGNDGRTYCRRKNGTTGLIVGGAAGALLGRGIDGGRDRTLGTVLGGVAGALLGREVDRGGSRCR